MKIQMNVLNEVQHYLETRNDTSSVVPSTLEIEDPTLNQLLNKLHTSQSEYARLRKTTAENNPILSSVKDEIDKTKVAVMETIKSQKANLHTSQIYVDQISNRDSAMANAIPQKEKELVEVSRQRNITAEIYSFLLQKREEAASYSVSSILPDSYIVDKASSSVNPVSPKKSLVWLLAIALLSFRKFPDHLKKNTKQQNFIQNRYRIINPLSGYRGNYRGKNLKTAS